MAEAQFDIRAQDKTKMAFASAEKGLNKFRGAMKSLNMGMVGGFLGGAGFARFAKSSLSAADNIDNLSQRLGLGIESVQSMKVMMEETGMSAESLEGTMGSLQRRLAEAQSGDKTAAQAFRDLGLSLQDIQNMNPEQALEAVARSLANNKGNAAATAAGFDILGSRSAKLQSIILKLGEKGFKSLNAEMIKAGHIMQTDMVKGLDVMDERLDRTMRRLSVRGQSAFAKGLSNLVVNMEGVGSFLAGGGFEAGRERAARDLMGGNESAQLVSPEARQNARARAEIQARLDQIQQAREARDKQAEFDQADRIQSLKTQLAMAEAKPLEDALRVGFGDSAGLNQRFQQDLGAAEQRKREEERNKVLKEIRDEIKRQQGEFVITE